MKAIRMLLSLALHWRRKQIMVIVALGMAGGFLKGVAPGLLYLFIRTNSATEQTEVLGSMKALIVENVNLSLLAILVVSLVGVVLAHISRVSLFTLSSHLEIELSRKKLTDQSGAVDQQLFRKSSTDARVCANAMRYVVLLVEPLMIVFVSLMILFLIQFELAIGIVLVTFISTFALKKNMQRGYQSVAVAASADQEAKSIRKELVDMSTGNRDEELHEKIHAAHDSGALASAAHNFRSRYKMIERAGLISDISSLIFIVGVVWYFFVYDSGADNVNLIFLLMIVGYFISKARSIATNLVRINNLRPFVENYFGLTSASSTSPVLSDDMEF